MADGTSKPISQIQVGDYVLATDPETGETGARRVIATLPHTDQLLALKTSAGDIITTEDHKYWNATDQRWQESQHFDEGDRLLTADGDRVTVEGLDWSTVHTDAAYDLTIDEIHTFYVSAGDEDVLVHNCAPKIPGPSSFDPSDLRGLSADDVVSRIPDGWTRGPSNSGGGTMFRDPANPGRQIRVMPGYPSGSRPDLITAGPYAVVSQNGQTVKIPLAGNPAL